MSEEVITIDGEEGKRKFAEAKQKAIEESKRLEQQRDAELLGNLLKVKTEGKLPKANLFAMSLIEKITTTFPQHGNVWATVACIWVLMNQNNLKLREMTNGEIETSIWQLAMNIENSEIEEYSRMIGEALSKNSSSQPKQSKKKN